jgi:hypothetical protein
MSGEKQLPKDAETAKVEAKNDADKIKGAGSPEDAYQQFRNELDELEKGGVDSKVRAVYRQQLKESLGADIDKVIVGYIKDDSAGGKLKSPSGYVSKESVKDAIISQDFEVSDADKALPRLLLDNFSKIAHKNADSSDQIITTGDLKATNDEFAAQVEKGKSLNDIKGSKVSALLDSTSDRLFDDVDTANQWTSTPDKVVSKNDVDRFLRENPNPGPSEKESYEALKYIQAHWNDDIGKQLRGWDEGRREYRSHMSKDSIAQALGYANCEDFRTKSKVEVQKNQTPVDRDEVVKDTYKFTYGDAQREYRTNAAGQLVSYSETNGKTTSNFTVDSKGTVRDITTGAEVKTNVNLNVQTGELKYHAKDGEKIDKPTEDKKQVEQRDTKVAETVTAKFEKGTREFRLNAKKELIGYTDKESGKDPKEFTVDGNGNVFEKGKEQPIATSAKLDVANKKFTYHNEKGDASESFTVTETKQQKTDKKSFLDAAKQQPKEGYWQVGAKILEATSGPEDGDKRAMNAENIILMNALKKQQKGNLKDQQFVQNKDDIERLKTNIEAFVAQNPRYKKYAEALEKRLDNAVLN